jgi:hypothetical protein
MDSDAARISNLHHGFPSLPTYLGTYVPATSPASDVETGCLMLAVDDIEQVEGRTKGSIGSCGRGRLPTQFRGVAQLECLEPVILSLDASQSLPLISISLEPTPAARPRTAAALQSRAATTTMNSQWPDADSCG